MNEREIERLWDKIAGDAGESGPLSSNEFELLKDPETSREESRKLLLRYILSGRQGSPLFERQTEDEEEIPDTRRLDELLAKIRTKHNEITPATPRRGTFLFSRRFILAPVAAVIAFVVILVYVYRPDGTLNIRTRGGDNTEIIRLEPTGEIDTLLPLFTWNGAPDGEFVLTIMDSHFREIFTKTVQGDRYRYSPDDPVLEPGERYYWEVRSAGEGKTPGAAAYFTVRP